MKSSSKLSEMMGILPDTPHHDMSSLLKCLSDGFGYGIIVFDRSLEIVFFTELCQTFLTLDSHIDKVLNAGTDGKINWTDHLTQFLQTGQSGRFDRIRYLFKEQPRYVDILLCPILSADGQSCGAVGVFRDVTIQVIRDNELAHTQRLTAIGKLAGKVAHELNNPLDGILRYINLSLRVLEQNNPDKAQEYLRQCRTGLLRMVQILSELLEFSRASQTPRNPESLDKIVQDAIESMRPRLAGIDVQVQHLFSGTAMHTPHDNLFQVFCNLIKNAADAMNGSGSLQIRIEQDDQNWLVHFQDSGPGIPLAMRDAVFQPFFTTKLNGQGTGLGLAICKDIVEKYQGQIVLHCPQSGGSIFTVKLPRQD